MNKRILFLNLRSYKVERMEPFEAAKRLGVSVVLVCDTLPDIDTTYYEEAIVCDTFDMEKTLEVVEAYHQKKPVDGVVTWSDKDVQLVAMIGERLHLPALSTEASLLVRNKFEMREKIKDNYPELCPKFAKVETWEDFQEAFHQLGTPAILKPVGASGSKAIFKIERKTDLKEVYQKITAVTDKKKDKVYSYFPRQYIYEEFLTGEEISLEGLVVCGQVLLAGVTDKK